MTLSDLASASREVASLSKEGLSFSGTTREIMRLIRSLVPCDTINLGTIDLDTEEGFHFSLDGFLMPPQRRALLPKFKHQHPMLEHARLHGLNPPLRFSDFCTRRQFEERPIYRECYKGYTHSMLTFGISAPAGLNVSFVLSRASGEFSEGDCEYLAVLQPVISSVLRQGMLQDALTTTKAQGRQAGVAYGAGPYLHLADEYAIGLLKTHFTLQSRHRLPQLFWNNIVLHFGATTTVKRLQEGGRLCARIGPTLNSWRLELWEDLDAISTQSMSQFNLTDRQQEVLQWMAKGKSNWEIAMILGVSHRTVEKHLEGIYRQLGVENRLAALSVCRNLPGSF